MKTALVLVLAVILAWFLFHVLEVMLAVAIGLVIKIAMIALFCAVVYWIFKAMTGDKQRI